MSKLLIISFKRFNTPMNLFVFLSVFSAAVCSMSVSASERPLVGSLSAQGQRGEGAMSLTEALALALHTHPLSASRESDYQAAQGELTATRWAVSQRLRSMRKLSQIAPNSDPRQSVNHYGREGG